MGSVKSFGQMNLQKEIQPRKSCKLRKICCFNLAKLTKKSFLEDLKLSILWESAVLYSRYLKRCKYCSHRPWTKLSNRVPSHIFFPNMPLFFLQRFICHIFIFHVRSYAAILISSLFLPLSCLLLHCLLLHILLHFCLQFL